MQPLLLVVHLLILVYRKDSANSCTACPADTSACDSDAAFALNSIICNAGFY
jgi:hypothetical protein